MHSHGVWFPVNWCGRGLDYQNPFFGECTAEQAQFQGLHPSCCLCESGSCMDSEIQWGCNVLSLCTHPKSQTPTLKTLNNWGRVAAFKTAETLEVRQRTILIIRTKPTPKPPHLAFHLANPQPTFSIVVLRQMQPTIATVGASQAYAQETAKGQVSAERQPKVTQQTYPLESTLAAKLRVRFSVVESLEGVTGPAPRVVEGPCLCAAGVPGVHPGNDALGVPQG